MVKIIDMKDFKEAKADLEKRMKMAKIELRKAMLEHLLKEKR